MKKIFILSLAFLLIFSFTANAQNEVNKKAKGPTIEERVGKMATDLGLTAEVKANVQKLFVKQADDLKKFRAENNKEAEDFAPKLKDLKKAQSLELKDLIGAEKFKKFNEINALAKKNQQ